MHHKRLVPSLHSRRERIWSVEEPLCLLCLHAGLAHSTGGGRAVRDPQPTKHRDDGGGGREVEGEEDQADDQRQTTGGEKSVEKKEVKIDDKVSKDRNTFLGVKVAS